MSTILVEDVKIDVEHKTWVDGRGKTHNVCYTVSPISSAGSFRYGISVADDRSLAERVKRCMLAQKFFSDLQIKTDIYGEEYISSTANVLGRHLNASLKKLGF